MWMVFIFSIFKTIIEYKQKIYGTVYVDEVQKLNITCDRGGKL